MSPVYNYVTFAQAKQQLANRLYDTTKQFWNDGELSVYIKESMRTWNALTAYWRNDFTFPSQQNVTWYDLTDTSTMPGTLRPYTLTDADIYTAIQYHLLEPVGPISPWTGVSAQFTADDVINATLRRRDELLSVTGCTLTRRLVPAVAGRIALPDTVIDVRRMAFLPAVVIAVTDSFNRADQSPINTNWKTCPRLGNTNRGQVLGNRYVSDSVAGADAVYDGGIPWPNDHFSQATLVALVRGSGYASLLVRSNEVNGLSYALVLDASLVGNLTGGMGEATPLRIFDSANNNLGGTIVIPQFGDVYRMEAQGGQIRAYRNSVLVLTVTDASVASGKPGISAAPFFGSLTDIAWDDWSGGGIISGAASVIWPDDTWSEQSFNRGYLQQPSGVPSAYLLSTEPPISFDVDAVPPPGGNYELLTVETNPSLAGLATARLASDDFNRADQNPVNTNWKSLLGSFVAGQVSNNTYIGQTAASAEMLYDGGVTWPSDQYSKATLRALTPNKGLATLLVRQHIGSDVANGDGYGFTIGDSTGTGGGIGVPSTISVDKISGGVNTRLATGSIVPQVGDVFMITVIGSTVTAYRNEAAILGMSVVDPDIASGNPGIGADTTLGIATDIAWDDWEGGQAISTGLLVPDDWVHVIKWGALADLLSRESNAQDSLRAAYCEQRYRMGLALLASAPALLAMRIGNEPLQVDAVRAADQYQTTWQAAAPGTPAMALHAGLNKIALSPAANAGPFSLTATVVQNAPVPTVDGDPLQVARDDLDVILDYAQHLAAFKMGGQEFLATIPLLQRFMKKAEVYGLKLAELGEYTSVLYALSQRENQMNPRMAPEPPDNGGSGGGNG